MRFSFLAPRRGPATRLAALLSRWLGYVEASPRTQYAFVGCAFMALACSLLSLWEGAETRAAQARYEASRVELARIDRGMSRLREVTGVVERLGEKASRVADARGRAAARIQAIEAVGDRVARRAWLVALHEESGTLRLRGRARSASDLGVTLDGLRGLRAVGGARLDALHALSGPQAGIVEFDVLLREAP